MFVKQKIKIQAKKPPATKKDTSNYHKFSLYLILLTLATYVGWWRLVSIAPGFSSKELETISSSSDISGWLSLPIQPLTHIGQWLVLQVWGLSSFGLRSVSVLLSLLAIIMFFMVIKSWTNTLNAVLSSVLVGCSIWWLSITRLAIPSSEMIFWIILFIMSLWMMHTKRSKTWWLTWCISMIGLAYNPGGIWIIIATFLALLASKHSLSLLRHIKQTYKLLGLAMFVVGLMPLAISVIRNPDYTKEFLNINTDFTINNILTNLWHASANLFAQLPHIDPAYGLNGSLVLRLVFAVMLALGVIAIIRKASQLDTNFGYLLIAIMLTSIASSALQSHNQPSPLVLTSAAFIVGAGVWYLTHIWVSLFPKNPYARTFGQVLVCLLVGYSAINSYNMYSQTWAYTPASTYAFSPQLSEARNSILNSSNNLGPDCQFVYDSGEAQSLKLTPYLWGRLSKPSTCQNISIVQYGSEVDSSQTILFSTKAWQQLGADQQKIAFSRGHQLIANDRSNNSLNYWIFNPAQNPDTIDEQSKE